MGNGTRHLFSPGHLFSPDTFSRRSVWTHNNNGPCTFTTRSTNPTAVNNAAQNAEKAVVDQKLAGSLEKAQQAARNGDEIAPGLFKYQETDSIAGYAQHHLWPQAMGGPKEGWTVYARQPHQTVAGIQGRLNTFLRGQTGKAQRELEAWARDNPDQLLPYLRDFYKNEGIPFPY